MESMTGLLDRCAPASAMSSGHHPDLAHVARGGSRASSGPRHSLPHTCVCSTVRRADESLDAELDTRGLAWLLLHVPGRLARPAGLRVGGGAGPRSYRADSTPMLAPAAGARTGMLRTCGTRCARTAHLLSMGLEKEQRRYRPRCSFQLSRRLALRVRRRRVPQHGSRHKRYHSRDLGHLGVDPVTTEKKIGNARAPRKRRSVSSHNRPRDLRGHRHSRVGGVVWRAPCIRAYVLTRTLHAPRGA